MPRNCCQTALRSARNCYQTAFRNDPNCYKTASVAGSKLLPNCFWPARNCYQTASGRLQTATKLLPNCSRCPWNFFYKLLSNCYQIATLQFAKRIYSRKRRNLTKSKPPKLTNSANFVLRFGNFSVYEIYRFSRYLSQTNICRIGRN